MQAINIRPVTDLRNKFNEIAAYQSMVDPMEEILMETDRIAANDSRRFTADEVYRRLKDHACDGRRACRRNV